MINTQPLTSSFLSLSLSNPIILHYNFLNQQIQNSPTLLHTELYNWRTKPVRKPRHRKKNSTKPNHKRKRKRKRKRKKKIERKKLNGTEIMPDAQSVRLPIQSWTFFECLHLLFFSSSLLIPVWLVATNLANLSYRWFLCKTEKKKV